jgi:hypothetical protein
VTNFLLYHAATCFTLIGEYIISVEQTLIAKPQCPLCRAFFTFTDLIRLKIKLLVDDEEDLAVDETVGMVVSYIGSTAK